MGELSEDTRNYLSYKFHVECLGRKPSAEDRQLRAEQIKNKGVTWVYATLYESDEAKAFRAERGW